MRPVHDLWCKQGSKAFVAFIQHGNRDKGFSYECVCPYCEKTLGDHFETDGTNGSLFEELLVRTTQHLSSCTAGGFKLNVIRATRPLGTDKDIVTQ